MEIAPSSLNRVHKVINNMSEMTRVRNERDEAVAQAAGLRQRLAKLRHEKVLLLNAGEVLANALRSHVQKAEARRLEKAKQTSVFWR